MRKNNNLVTIPRNKSRLKILKRLFFVFIIIYIALGFFVHFSLERVILWPKNQFMEVPALAMQEGRLEDIELTMKDGNILRGWLVKNSTTEKANLLIYFGGNAEELSSVIRKMSKLDNWYVALINYRGYGSSKGLSNETTLYSDSLEIFDYMIKRDDINKKNIVVMGRSIGTGVSTYLAKNRSTSAVILSTPYDTMESVIQEKCPVLPIGLILSHKYDSIGRAPLIRQPLLVLVGGKDNIIPNWHSERIKEAWGGKVTYHMFPDEDHNSIDDTDEYWAKIIDFLSEYE